MNNKGSKSLPCEDPRCAPVLIKHLKLITNITMGGPLKDAKNEKNFLTDIFW